MFRMELPVAYHRQAIGWGIPELVHKFMPLSRLKLMEQVKVVPKDRFTDEDLEKWRLNMPDYHQMARDLISKNNMRANQDVLLGKRGSPHANEQTEAFNRTAYMISRYESSKPKKKVTFQEPRADEHLYARYPEDVALACDSCHSSRQQRNYLSYGPNAGSACAGTCAQCGCRFRSFDELKEHKRAAHKEGRPIDTEEVRNDNGNQPKWSHLDNVENQNRHSMHLVRPCVLNSMFPFRHHGFQATPHEYVRSAYRHNT